MYCALPEGSPMRGISVGTLNYLVWNWAREVGVTSSDELGQPLCTRAARSCSKEPSWREPTWPRRCIEGVSLDTLR